MVRYFENFENLNQLLETYKNWDKIFENFKNKFNINCISYCSRCCDTDIENIQSTIFELLPSAIIFYVVFFEKKVIGNDIKDKDNFFSQIVQNKFLIKKVYDFIFNRTLSDRCIFYIKEENKWGCSIYDIRPAICRLFGFSFKKDKKANLIYNPCKELKKIGIKNIVIEDKNEDKTINKVTDKNINKNSYPIYDTLYNQILSLNYQYTNEFFSINEAFSKAFDIVYFKFNYNREKAS